MRNFRVKYQESSMGYENLAHLQFIENKYNICGRFSGHVIHTNYDIKIITNQRFCHVPQNLTSVQTKH